MWDTYSLERGPLGWGGLIWLASFAGLESASRLASSWLVQPIFAE